MTRRYLLAVAIVCAVTVSFTALAVIHIQLSHFFATDTLLTLFGTAAIFFMFQASGAIRL